MLKFKPKKEIIHSVSELSEIIHDLQESRGISNALGNGMNYEMYRGQGSEDWNLVPNLCRIIKEPSELKRIEKDMVQEFHDELVKHGKTKRLQQGFLHGHHHSNWLLIQQAQHYELPTRFMDCNIYSRRIIIVGDQEILSFINNKNPEKFDTSQGFLGLQPYRLGFFSLRDGGLDGTCNIV